METRLSGTTDMGSTEGTPLEESYWESEKPQNQMILGLFYIYPHQSYTLYHTKNSIT